jgi:hypothetical protein
MNTPPISIRHITLTPQQSKIPRQTNMVEALVRMSSIVIKVKFVVCIGYLQREESSIAETTHFRQTPIIVSADFMTSVCVSMTMLDSRKRVVPSPELYFFTWRLILSLYVTHILCVDNSDRA